MHVEVAFPAINARCDGLHEDTSLQRLVPLFDDLCVDAALGGYIDEAMREARAKETHVRPEGVRSHDKTPGALI
eukprot:CAMPEP_0115837270 /NCGR_PEP_ID=MMETSP0287-20121206/5133_1 /TAXON_ID=412157 /ORGANISM="Chrysochromulina rotalis, Strain UIO044" /LENGTH=73 /DNA_ID=CAMNT_0003290773 /DNA_START=430 /DNA_END=651 /DNA_ORIENTATION=-